MQTRESMDIDIKYSQKFLMKRKNESNKLHKKSQDANFTNQNKEPSTRMRENQNRA